MKVAIATVRLLIDTDNEDEACDGVTGLLTERMKIYEPLSSLIDWRYEYGGAPVIIDIQDTYTSHEGDVPEHPCIGVVDK